MFAKLFSSITESSLWSEPKEVRLLFVTMLAKADQNGFVEASIPGLARVANLTIEETELGLECLQSADQYSKNPDNEGRRVLQVPGGFVLLNYADYRERRNTEERREYMREYMQNYRKKKSGCKQLLTSVNPSKPRLAKTETETETETGKKKTTSSKKFVPPTLEQVAEYCKERENSINPEMFLSHYEANGWMRGKSKVKCWKACVRTWEARDKQNETSVASFSPAWGSVVKFASTDGLATGYTQRLTERLGEDIAKAAKAVGLQEIARANEFQLSDLKKRFLAEVQG